MRINEPLYGLLDFIDENVTKDTYVVEIGTYTGESTVLFARKANFIHTIDPYIQDYDENDGAGETDLQLVHRIFLERLKNSKTKNVYQYCETSQEAVKHFKKGSIDVLYIDGLHTYEGVRSDIQHYLPLIKRGGIIAGHDYDWEGVKKAVNECLGEPNKVYIVNTWMFKL